MLTLPLIPCGATLRDRVLSAGVLLSVFSYNIPFLLARAVFLFSTLMLVRLLQPLNAESPTDDTFLGREMLVKLLQFKNAESPIIWSSSDSNILTVFSDDGTADALLPNI